MSNINKRDTTFDRLERNLYKDKDEASKELTPKEMEIKNRLMLCVTKKMEDPLIEDSKLVEFLTNGCGGITSRISKSQAYRDVAMINRLVGNVQLSAKSWYRYMIVEGGKKAFQLAIDKEDAKGAAAALDKIGKYTRSDKDDDQFDFESLIPPSFEPSDDITLIEGMEKMDNLEEERKNFRSLFKREATEVIPIQEKKEP